jgi:hypothetical protein
MLLLCTTNRAGLQTINLAPLLAVPQGGCHSFRLQPQTHGSRAQPPNRGVGAPPPNPNWGGVTLLAGALKVKQL